MATELCEHPWCSETGGAGGPAASATGRATAALEPTAGARGLVSARTITLTVEAARQLHTFCGM